MTTVARSSDEAFVLGVQDLQERDRIVDLFSRHHGRRRAVARGSRTRHSRFAGQLQLLSLVRVDWWEREGRDLGRLEAVEIVRPAKWIDHGLEEMLLAFYLAEHVAIFAPEGHVDDPLFRLLDTVTQALDAGCHRELATAYFEVWILRLAGISPSWRECAACGAELTTSASLVGDLDALVCGSCGSGRSSNTRLDTSALALARDIGRSPLAQLAPTAFSPAALRSVRAVTAAIRRGYLQHELRSWTVMSETLGRVGPAP